MKRIGISLRSSHATGYHEPRDALARDWYGVFAELNRSQTDAKKPQQTVQYSWIMLPNIGKDIAQYVKHWQLDGVILSGGDDIGAEPIRDETEHALIDYCQQHNLPILGVCRGAQLLGQRFGATLCSVSASEHVATHHQLSTKVTPWATAQTLKVNSYHTQACQLPLPDSLQLLAHIEEHAEAFMHTNAAIVGIMWHPERESHLSEFDQQLITWLFK